MRVCRSGRQWPDCLMSCNATSWLGLAEASPPTLDSLKEGGTPGSHTWFVVLIQYGKQQEHLKLHEGDDSAKDNTSAAAVLSSLLTTAIVQVIPSPVLDDGVIYVHPVLYDVLQPAAERLWPVGVDNNDPDGDHQESTKFPFETVTTQPSSLTFVSIAPIPALTELDTTTSIEEENQEDQPQQQQQSSYRSNGRCSDWTAVVTSGIRDLPLKCRINVCVIHWEEEIDNAHSSGSLLNKSDNGLLYHAHLAKKISSGLFGRLIRMGSVMVLSLHRSCVAVIGIISLYIPDSCHGEDDQVEGRSGCNNHLGHDVFRIGANHLDYDVCLDTNYRLPPACITTKSLCNNHGGGEVDCPGYEFLLQELLQYISMMTTLPAANGDTLKTAAPSGILLAGCTGVGKTRLASSLVHHLTQINQEWQTNTTLKVHWVSMHDVLLRATTETDLVGYLLPKLALHDPTTMTTEQQQHWLIVLDDLHVLESAAIEESTATERLLVHNAVLQALDQRRSNCMFLAVAQSASRLPGELRRIGRLEYTVAMYPPTQAQREAILIQLLYQLSSPQASSNWSKLLAAAPTAGFVAADLCRMCTDALTRTVARKQHQQSIASMPTAKAVVSDYDYAVEWEDLREAARWCIPSQLAQLDVTKPPQVIHNRGEAADIDWMGRHEQSWRAFRGYSSVKKRIYRTVVAPWKRRLEDGNTDSSNCVNLGIDPPKGVLFHGPSGCGKTLAARCLASSLGLAVVKVRAADVLDKWLGGSEAIVRSLFERARSASPCILFFDELDAIASNRATGDHASSDVSSRLLSTFLNELDGISSSNKQSFVLVLACTNRIDALDAALLRPGRLEEHVLLAAPTLSDVEDILRLYTELLPLDDSVELANLALTLFDQDASGADIEGLCREACFMALQRRKDSQGSVVVNQGDFYNAIRVRKRV